MTVFRWIIALVAIVMIAIFAGLAHGAATAADGGILAPQAFRFTLWAVVTYFIANLLMKLGRN